MSADPVTRIRFTDPDQLLHAVPSATLALTPSRAGTFSAELTTIRVGGAFLQLGRCSPAIIMAEAAPGACIVQLPFAGIEEFRLNGRPMTAGLVGLYGAGGTLERVSQQTTSHAALILPAAEAEALLVASPASALLRTGGQVLLQSDPVLWQRAVQLSRSIAAAVDQDAAMVLQPEALRSVRASILDAIGELLSGEGLGGPPRQLRNSSARRRIVNVSNEYLIANRSRAIYTEDLCKVLHISPARLADAFRASFNITPHRFLKLRRLAMVRSVLRHRDGPPPNVSGVAHAHGFWHLGHFAREYRALYGETPSETRARTWGPPTPGAQGADPGGDGEETEALLRQA